MNGRVDPYPYQKQGVRMMEATGRRALLSDSTGLGKTLTVLHLARRNPDAWPLVVVCPASVKYHWERQAAIQIGVRATVLEGERPPKHGGLLDTGKLFILNYDILQYWLPWLIRLNPRSLFLDECHNLCNPDTKRTKATFALVRTCQIPCVVAISATPLTNRTAELWPTLNILWPDKFPSYVQYGLTYCKPRFAYGKWSYHGSKNMGQLHDLLLECGMVRRLKEDVLSELPPKTRRTIPVDINNHKEYAEARDNFRAWIRQVGGAKRAKAASMTEKLVQIGYLRRLAAKGKIKAVIEWIDHFLETTDEKLVVFAVHKKMIGALQRRYHNQSTFITGAVVGRKRQAAVDQFRKDPYCRIIFGNIKAMSAGVDGLQGACRTMLFAEVDWRPGDHTQAEDRIWRIGQKYKAWIYYLIAHGTIEEKMCEIIQQKQADISMVLDGGADIGTELDILDQLIEHLANAA